MSSIAHPTTARPLVPVRPAQRSISATNRYGLAVAIALVGLAAGLTLGATTYRDAQRHVDTFERVSIPGVMTVAMAAPDGRVVYYEGDERVGYGDLTIAVTGPTGAAVEVDRYDGEMIYETRDATQGRALATFEADEPGAYLVDVGGVDTGQLAIGDSFARHVLPGVLGGLAIAGLSMIAGFVLWVVTFTKRSSDAAPPSGAVDP